MKYKLKNAALFSPTKAATGLGKVFRSTYQDASSTISLFSEAAIAVRNLHCFKAFTWQCFCVSPGLLALLFPAHPPQQSQKPKPVRIDWVCTKAMLAVLCWGATTRLRSPGVLPHQQGKLLHFQALERHLEVPLHPWVVMGRTPNRKHRIHLGLCSIQHVLDKVQCTIFHYLIITCFFLSHVLGPPPDTVLSCLSAQCSPSGASIAQQHHRARKGHASARPPLVSAWHTAEVQRRNLAPWFLQVGTRGEPSQDLKLAGGCSAVGCW